MNFASDALSLLAASQMILLLVISLVSKVRLSKKISGAALMLGCILYFVIPVYEAHAMTKLHAIVWLPAATAPSSLLVFVWCVFEESECKMPVWMMALIGLSIIAALYFATLNVVLPNAPFWVHGLELVIVGVAFYVVFSGTETDLDETRFKARKWFVASLAGLMLFSITLSIDLLPIFLAHDFVEVLEKSLVFVFALSVNIYLIKMNSLFEQEETTPLDVEEIGDPLITELLDKMRSERLYADHDLRVGGLAETLNVPEYQLRKRINQQLGYRNFNQFVNQYRIEEAGEKLLQNKRLPVLTIALDVGFRSISSFNSAFQSHYGVSPTVYRQNRTTAKTEKASMAEI